MATFIISVLLSALLAAIYSIRKTRRRARLRQLPKLRLLCAANTIRKSSFEDCVSVNFRYRATTPDRRNPQPSKGLFCFVLPK